MTGRDDRGPDMTHSAPRSARTTELRSGLTAIEVLGRGLLRGAADPRRDGAAVGF